MELSLCMIARDEAEILGQALASVRELVDEIVLVDTGSEDDTVALARGYGARVLEVPWCDDFAAARNASLEAARGRWLLILDADEVLEPEDCRRVAETVAADRDEVYTFDQRNYVQETSPLGWRPNDGSCPLAADYDGFVPARQLRLVPARLGLRYRGPVHESMEEDVLEGGWPLIHSPIRVHHFGKVRSQAVMERKQRLYRELGRRKVEMRADDPQAWFEMGVQYAELGEDEEARRAFERLLDLDPLDWHRSRAQALLGEIHVRAGRAAEAVELLEEALRGDPSLPNVWGSLAHALVAAGRPARAVRILEAGVQAHPEHPGLRGYLGLLYLDLAQWEVARRCFEEVERLHPRGRAGRVGRALCLLLQRADVERALGILAEGGVEDLREVTRQLLCKGRLEPALALLRRCEPALRRQMACQAAEAALRLGRGGEAGSWLRQAPAEEVPFALVERLLTRPEGFAPAEVHVVRRSGAGHAPAQATRALLLSRLGAGAWATAVADLLGRDPGLSPAADRLRAVLGGAPVGS